MFTAARRGGVRPSHEAPLLKHMLQVRNHVPLVTRQPTTRIEESRKVGMLSTGDKIEEGHNEVNQPTQSSSTPPGKSASRRVRHRGIRPKVGQRHWPEAGGRSSRVGGSDLRRQLELKKEKRKHSIRSQNEPGQGQGPGQEGVSRGIRRLRRGCLRSTGRKRASGMKRMGRHRATRIKNSRVCEEGDYPRPLPRARLPSPSLSFGDTSSFSSFSFLRASFSLFDKRPPFPPPPPPSR